MSRRHAPGTHQVGERLRGAGPQRGRGLGYQKVGSPGCPAALLPSRPGEPERGGATITPAFQSHLSAERVEKSKGRTRPRPRPSDVRRPL